MENAGTAPQAVLTAYQAGLVGCTECGRASPRGTVTCPRCGRALRPLSRRSLQTVWAWMAAGIVFYIPANVYPMLVTTYFGRTSDNTIVGGAIELGQGGDWAIAGIVLLASVVIPITKFIAIAYLAIAVTRSTGSYTHRRHRLYETVEFIGRWSMVDVFVVAIVSALVQVSMLAMIKPGVAAVSFALSVAFTMLSAQSFDPRLIWQVGETEDE